MEVGGIERNGAGVVQFVCRQNIANIFHFLVGPVANVIHALLRAKVTDCRHIQLAIHKPAQLHAKIPFGALVVFGPAKRGGVACVHPHNPRNRVGHVPCGQHAHGFERDNVIG